MSGLIPLWSAVPRWTNHGLTVSLRRVDDPHLNNWEELLGACIARISVDFRWLEVV